MTRTYEHVPLEQFATASVEPIITPLPTVFLYVRHALSRGRAATKSSAGRPASAPDQWSRAALSHLRARDRAALAVLVDPRTVGWPTPLTEIAGRRSTMAQSLEQIAAVPGEAIVDHVIKENRNGVLSFAPWAPVLRDVDRWLQSYVEALERAWRGIEPLWTRAAHLLDREVERVDAATAVGAHDQLADSVHPFSSIDGGRWRLFEHPDEMALSVDRLRLTPLLIDTMCWIDSDGSTLRELAYPLPNVWRALDGLTPPPAALEALLGASRAQLLLRLERPVTVTELAEQLFIVPSGVTYHVRALEAAGLVSRVRRGQYVEVHRTPRALRLLELYERA